MRLLGVFLVGIVAHHIDCVLRTADVLPIHNRKTHAASLTAMSCLSAVKAFPPLGSSPHPILLGGGSPLRPGGVPKGVAMGVRREGLRGSTLPPMIDG